MNPENYQKIQELMRNRDVLNERLKLIEKPRLVAEVKEQISAIETELRKL